MTRSRFSPLRLIEDWDSLYWEVNQSDEDPPVVPKRTRVAWWYQHHIDTGTAVWHVLTAPRERMYSDHSNLELWERVFYGGKAILCLLAGRNGLTLGHRRMTESFPIVYFDLQQYGTPDGPGGSCEEVQVGSGVLENWFAYVERESWP